MEEERPAPSRPHHPRNPYRNDPCYETKEEADRFVASCEVVKIPTIPLKQAEQNSCDCEKCGEVLVWQKTSNASFEHLCCRQVNNWQGRIDEGETVKCVTTCEAYLAVTNKHAVHNVLLMCKPDLSEKGQVLQNPPSNENWRYGCYKATNHLLIFFTLSFAYRNVIGIDQLAFHDIYLFCQVFLSGCLLCVVFNRPGVSRAVLQTAL